MQPESEKHDFLVAYDYGMGALWGVIRARSEREIATTYPELVIVREIPTWLTDEQMDRIRATELHDIDGAPWGMLNAVLADRGRRS